MTLCSATDPSCSGNEQLDLQSRLPYDHYLVRQGIHGRDGPGQGSAEHLVRGTKRRGGTVTNEPPASDRERRARKRVRSRCTVRYRQLNEAGALEQTAKTKDLSSSGLAFETPTCLPIGSELEILLDIPNVSPGIKGDAQVARLQAVDEGKKYVVGITFKSLPESSGQAIEEHVQDVDVDHILREAVQQKASGLHLAADHPPLCRVDGNLMPLDMPPLPPERIDRIVMAMMSDRQREQFLKNLELDFSYVLPEGVRFRVNAHMAMGNIEATLRIISTRIRSVRELGLPPIVEQLANLRKGLIIVTGSAGSGTSTTLAAIVDLINSQRSCMIISVEDPIEHVHSSQLSIVKQREVGTDTHSFANAIKHALRQDPNVLLIGETRDADSISMSIAAAKAGHLVLTSLHAASTVECINTVVDAYPASQHGQVRNRLAECLQAIICQVLLPRKDGNGLAVATEVLVCTPAIRSLIRQGQTEQIPSYIQSGAQAGMHLLDSSLLELASAGVIDFETARSHARNPAKLTAVGK